MMTKELRLIGFAAIALAMTFTACEKEFDTPPPTVLADGDIRTIMDLRDTLAIYGEAGYKFTEDYSLFATVTADGASGNFFRNVYMQDDSAAVNMRTVDPGGLYIGDYIRVNLKGAVVSEYGGMLQLDSVDVDQQVFIQANEQFVDPLEISLSDLSTDIANLQGMLVRIPDTEFAEFELGSTYADAINLLTINRTVQDCSGAQSFLRTSGFANFAGDSLPTLTGNLTAIAGVFNDDVQLLIRDTRDLDFTEVRCIDRLISLKDFEDQSATSGGWTQQTVVGSETWSVGEFNNNHYIFANNYNGSGNDVAEAWYISPAMDLTAIANPKFSFVTQSNFSGPDLEVYVSTDYDPNSPDGVGDATWTQYNDLMLSQGGYETVSSGPLSLSDHITSSTYIAFRYLGTATSGQVWQVDNIALFE